MRNDMPGRRNWVCKIYKDETEVVEGGKVRDKQGICTKEKCLDFYPKWSKNLLKMWAIWVSWAVSRLRKFTWSPMHWQGLLDQGQGVQLGEIVGNSPGSWCCARRVTVGLGSHEQFWIRVRVKTDKTCWLNVRDEKEWKVNGDLIL